MKDFILSKIHSVQQQVGHIYSHFAITPLVLTVGLFFISMYVDKLNYNQYLQAEKAAASLKLQATRAKLEGQINSNIQAIYALVAAIKAEPDMDQARYDQLSKYLLNDSNQLKIIAMAPNLVLTLTHPFEQNKQTIGFDYRSNAQQLPGVLTARDSKALVLAGPIELIQGGKAFLAHIPIYLPNKDDEEVFWGVATGVIDSEALFKISGLYDKDLGLDVTIEAIDERFADTKMVFGHHQANTKDAVSNRVELPFSHWKIYGIPKSGWPTHSPNANIFRLTLLVISLFILIPLLSVSWLSKKRKAETNRLINLFKLSPIGIVSIDFKTGKFIECNPSFLRRTGYTEAELKQKHFQELTPKEYYHQDKESIKQVSLTGQYGPFEKRVITKDQQSYPAVLNGMLSKESDEQPNIWSFIVDITESKKAEQEIALQKIQLELVIENASMGIWDWNIKTGELILNERWANIIGYTLEELSPVDINTWMDHALAEDLAESDRLLQACWDKPGSDYIFEARMRHKNGSIVWVLDSGKVIEWHQDGSPIRMVGTHIDITDRKINEKKLTEALDHANIATEAKSNFLATMSHEIRTPMNGILGMLELLSLSDMNAEQARKISIAESSANSLLAIINDILDFSKMDAGKLELECIEFNLREIIDNCAESLALHAQQKGLEILIDNTAIENTLVMGDPNRVRQILMNLLGNAIKFTHDGEVSITSLLTIAGSHLEFSCDIRDTGIGIPVSKLASLFNSFTQADTSTTREYGGTGLGLAISKKLALLMNGNILVCSEQGQGSEFKVRLQFKPPHRLEILKPKSDITGQQFLIIDRHKGNRELLKKQIEIWQGSVHLSKDMLSAKSILTDTKFDFVLIDYLSLNANSSNDLTNSLSVNAIDHGKIIRAFHLERPIKIILMVPMNLNSTKEMRMVFDLIIPKPISTFDFLNFIDSGFEKENHQLTPLIKNVDKSISVPSDETAWPQPCHILLVEDILFNQEVAIMMLEEIGLSADIANNGKQALSKLKADPSYTLVLMDCQMPEMDGFDASKAIRNGECGEHYSKLTIIALTANAMKADEDKCRGAGMDDYLSKPIDLELFKAKLKQYLV